MREREGMRGREREIVSVGSLPKPSVYPKAKVWVTLCREHPHVFNQWASLWKS